MEHKTIEVNGRIHLLVDNSSEANYRGTGMALAGVLNKDESLQTFLQRVNKVRNYKLDIKF